MMQPLQMIGLKDSSRQSFGARGPMFLFPAHNFSCHHQLDSLFDTRDWNEEMKVV